MINFSNWGNELRSVCKKLFEDYSRDLRAIVFLRDDNFFQFYIEYFDHDRFRSKDPPFWRPRSLSGLFEFEPDASADLEARFGEGLRKFELYPDEFELANWGNLDPRPR